MTSAGNYPDEDDEKRVKSTLKVTGQRRMKADGKMEQEWVRIEHDENGREIGRSCFWQDV